jgi:tripartite-type tricarboxylate transporter receptor subunit TctC
MLSPYGAGGSNDISLRILAEQFEQRMGQKFLVENRPGASSTIASQTVAHADPDGYTFSMRLRLLRPPKPCWAISTMTRTRTFAPLR